MPNEFDKMTAYRAGKERDELGRIEDLLHKQAHRVDHSIKTAQPVDHQQELAEWNQLAREFAREANALREKLAAAVAACAAEHPEVAELRKDAERWRFLLSGHHSPHIIFSVSDSALRRFGSVDEALDDAIEHYATTKAPHE